MNCLKVIIASTLMMLASNASATPITFTHTGTGSGSIGNSLFSDQSFVITATADTDDRLAFGSLFQFGGFTLTHLTASISLGVLGNFDFLIGTRTFVSVVTNTIGFSHTDFGGIDLYNGPTDPVFNSWDMLSDIGPVSGLGTLVQWDKFPVTTSGGLLSFAESPTTAQFSATLNHIPEPGTSVIIATGLIALMLGKRRNAMPMT